MPDPLPPAALDALLAEADKAHVKGLGFSWQSHAGDVATCPALRCRLAAALRSLRPPADATGTAICACGHEEGDHADIGDGRFPACGYDSGDPGGVYDCACPTFTPVADRYTYTVPRPDAARGGDDV